MSYQRAWVIAKTMSECFREPLIAATKGDIGLDEALAALRTFARRDTLATMDVVNVGRSRALRHVKPA